MSVKVAVVEQEAAVQERDPFHISVLTRITGNNDITIDSRVCNINDFQSRKWLTNHQFWAINQGHTVEMRPATSDEVQGYVAKQSKLLSNRYNK